MSPVRVTRQPLVILSGRGDAFSAGLDNATLAKGGFEREQLLAAMGERLLAALSDLAYRGTIDSVWRPAIERIRVLVAEQIARRDAADTNAR